MSSTDAIRKFNRFELKYILTLEQVELLKKDLLQYVVPDAHAENGRYTLSSLYYDTPDRRHYWEKIE
jgi:23S rRNA A2030 N6-methylase RlmJ